MMVAAVYVLHIVTGLRQLLQAHQRRQQQRQHRNAQRLGGQCGDGAHAEGGEHFLHHQGGDEDGAEAALVLLAGLC